MVIGNGLMAKAFLQFNEDDSVIIFASGVSNSSQTAEEEYKREKALLHTCFSKKTKLIYFSTCSITDDSIQHTQYIHHKLEMENLIKKKQDSYLVLRLPNVVGKSSNPHTLTNFIYNQIISSHSFQVYAHSCRYLIDVDDVFNIISVLLNNKNINDEIINVAFNNRINTIELVNLFEEVLSTRAQYELVNKGACYSIDNSRIKELIGEINFKTPEKYNINLLRKYYGILKTEFVKEKIK